MLATLAPRLGEGIAGEGGEQGVAVAAPADVGEDVFGYVRRNAGGVHCASLYARILGAANEFKEGDAIVGVAARDEASRRNARLLLERTRIAEIDEHALHVDEMYEYSARAVDASGARADDPVTLGELKAYLLTRSESDIKRVAAGLSSDVCACVVKLLGNDELAAVGSKLYNTLPGSDIGGEGFLGARVQPNSPTDNLDDIAWQVFNAFSYAVGDVCLGTNPVSSEPESVAAIERCLAEILDTFGISKLMPHCVLSHIDVQATVEKRNPKTTALWFQSIAGSDEANQTFDVSVRKMREASRKAPFGMYFETGQGADFTNGHSHGYDMLLHESRKYGFARMLAREVAGDSDGKPWVHLNDVAGFIGPEVFKTKEQLVRCCLEDIVMGKLHGLTLGLDVCSTLHMDVTLSDLDWCLDRILPARPAYLMALPTKIDPMLGYLSTSFQDHVRVREKHGLKVSRGMWTFYQSLGVVDANGRPTDRFGDPCHVYVNYRRRKGDARDEGAIRAEGTKKMAEVRARGLFLSEGHGDELWEHRRELQDEIGHIYADAKLSIWAEWDPKFILKSVPNALCLTTCSASRDDYITHPHSGEKLSPAAISALAALRGEQAGAFEVQIVVSDGLNALSLMEPGHLAEFLRAVREDLESAGRRVAPTTVVLTLGRVRAGYAVGEALFGGLPALTDGATRSFVGGSLQRRRGDRRCVVHVIGERPGTGHRTFSAYVTGARGGTWGRPGKVDHDITRLISGIARTATDPAEGGRRAASMADDALQPEEHASMRFLRRNVGRAGTAVAALGAVAAAAAAQAKRRPPRSAAAV